jgi:hypothetical protein
MITIKFTAGVAAMTLAAGACAQSAPPAPANPAPSTQPAMPEFRGPDERVADLNRLRDDIAARAPGPTKSVHPVPASPEDVVAGSEVRDSKGLVIGTVDRVGKGFAVVASPGGKIEVEFESFAKNNKGLLINMRKAKFDAIVAGAAKPGK